MNLYFYLQLLKCCSVVLLSVAYSGFSTAQGFAPFWDYPTYYSEPFYKGPSDCIISEIDLDSSLVVFYSERGDTVGANRLIQIKINDSILVVKRLFWGRNAQSSSGRVTVEIRRDGGVSKSIFKISDTGNYIPDYHEITLEENGLRKISQEVLVEDFTVDTIYNVLRGDYEYEDGSLRKTRYRAAPNFKPIALYSIKNSVFEEKGRESHFQEYTKAYNSPNKLDSSLVLEVKNYYYDDSIGLGYRYLSNILYSGDSLFVQGESRTKGAETLEVRSIRDFKTGDFVRLDSFYRHRDELGRTINRWDLFINTVCDKKYGWNNTFVLGTNWKQTESYFFNDQLYSRTQWFYDTNHTKLENRNSTATCVSEESTSSRRLLNKSEIPFAGHFQLLNARGLVVKDQKLSAGAKLKIARPRIKGNYTLIGFSDDQVCSSRLVF